MTGLLQKINDLLSALGAIPTAVTDAMTALQTFSAFLDGS